MPVRVQTEDFDLTTALIFPDDSQDYGEPS